MAAVETREQIKQLMMLQRKDSLELRSICEALGVSTEGQKEDLVRTVMSVRSTVQDNITRPQAIPLRTRDHNSRPIEAAKKAFFQWRRLIFQRGGTKEFSLLNGEGKTYQSKLKYINCSSGTALHIIRNKWYLPLDHQTDLIKVIEQHPDNFSMYVIQKPDKSGNSWLMLHAKARRK